MTGTFNFLLLTLFWDLYPLHFNHKNDVTNDTCEIYLSVISNYSEWKECYQFNVDSFTISKFSIAPYENADFPNLTTEAINFLLDDYHAKCLNDAKMKRSIIECVKGAIQCDKPTKQIRLEFSNIGFTQDEENCLVYAGFFIDELSGSGSLYFLSKVNDSWRIVSQRVLWQR